MMDVIRSQESAQDFTIRIDNIEQMINSNSSNNADISRLLDNIDEEVINGDFGGYYQMRRQHIQRIDELRSHLNIDVPARSDDIYTRPGIPSRLPFHIPGLSLSFNHPILGRRTRRNENNKNSDTLIFNKKGMFDEDTCAICLSNFSSEDYSNNDHGFIKCGHKFHKSCFYTHARVNTYEMLKCPMCRSDDLFR